MAHLGLPDDAEASLANPVRLSVDYAASVPPGWNRYTREPDGRELSSTLPPSVRMALPELLIAYVCGDTARVCVHRVNSAMQWRAGVPRVSRAQLEDALRVPGTLDAYTVASAVGGVDAGIAVLLAVLPEGGAARALQDTAHGP